MFPGSPRWFGQESPNRCWYRTPKRRRGEAVASDVSGVGRAHRNRPDGDPGSIPRRTLRVSRTAVPQQHRVLQSVIPRQRGANNRGDCSVYRVKIAKANEFTERFDSR